MESLDFEGVLGHLNTPLLLFDVLQVKLFKGAKKPEHLLEEEFSDRFFSCAETFQIRQLIRARICWKGVGKLVVTNERTTRLGRERRRQRAIRRRLGHVTISAAKFPCKRCLLHDERTGGCKRGETTTDPKSTRRHVHPNSLIQHGDRQADRESMICVQTIVHWL